MLPAPALHTLFCLYLISQSFHIGTNSIMCSVFNFHFLKFKVFICFLNYLKLFIKQALFFLSKEADPLRDSGFRVAVIVYKTFNQKTHLTVHLNVDQPLPWPRADH